ncbi:MAG: DUF2157 domain-containing protein [Chloroflexi bacterium]|nr:DUF2157 domain-containing protein [Chloroflexota bacterium]
MAESREHTGLGVEQFLEKLPRELSRWESDGIITSEQGQAILGSYSPSELAPASSRAQGRLVTSLSIVGSVLLGLGVILFFAANWDGIDRWPKVGIVLASIITAHGLGYYLRYHRDYRRVGSAMMLLACLIYGAGVHLIGQAYNVDVNDPSLMLFWFLGVLPLVYIVRSQPIQFLGLALFLLAVGFRLPDWLDPIPRGEAVLGLALFLILGLMILAIGRLKEEIPALRDYSEVFQLVGMITALGALFVLTFRDIFDSFNRGGSGGFIEGEAELGFRVMIVVAGALTLALVLAAAWLHRRREREFTLTGVEGVAIAILLAAAYVVIGVDTGGEVVFAVTFNVLLGVSLLGILVSGYLRGRELWVNIALLFIGVDVIARYFEYSWGLLDKSFIFVAAGVILLLGGFVVERGRQKMLERIRSGPSSS